MSKRISRRKTFTPSEAAAELGVHVSTVYRFMRSGRLGAEQYPTGTFRISRAALMEFRREARERAAFGVEGYARAEEFIEKTKRGG